MSKRTPVIEVFIGRDHKAYFRKRAANGKITSPSQGYFHKGNARRAARKLFPGVPIINIEERV